MEANEGARSKHSIRRWLWLWAGLWSAVFVSLWQLKPDPCSISTTTHNIVVALVMWTWLLVFFALSNRARLIQVAATIFCFAVSLGIPDLYSHTVLVESAAFRAVRATYISLEDYRQAHPAEGYPQELPEIKSKIPLKKLYVFAYTRQQNRNTGVFDQFTLSATPRNPVCGYRRSFAVTEAGTLSFTSEDRPATRTDPSVE